VTIKGRKPVPELDRSRVKPAVVEGEVVQNILTPGQVCSPGGCMVVKDGNRAGSSSWARAQTIS
jgi:hypothetical protein